MEPNTEPEANQPTPAIETNRPSRPVRRAILMLSGLLLLVMLFVTSFVVWFTTTQSRPPAAFPTDEPITIAPGMDVRNITELLAAEDVVRSPAFLYYVLVFTHDPATIKASTYVFNEPLNVYEVADRLTQGDFDTDLVRLTHIEGETVADFAAEAERALPNFSSAEFLRLASTSEGRLFPDTYFIPPTITEETLFELLETTLDERLEPLAPAIAEHPLSESEILILASILEREANSPESMRTVAGILLNRLEIDMALQADATIEYVIEEELGELPEGDPATRLRETDSPYNTYQNPGLPPTPIGNPGLTAIKAVLEPIESEYFYYLTAPDGTFHYAETYDEHLTNIQRHLR